MRWRWEPGRPLVEHTARIDVRDLRRSHLLPKPGDGERTAGEWDAWGNVVPVDGLGRSWAELHLDLDSGHGSAEVRFGNGRASHVWLQATRQNFGGWRWWWTCGRCSRRCQAVYDAQPMPGCWRCCGLAYETTRLDEDDRRMIVTRRKLARIERRLGKVYEIGGHRVRFKPSGMWATTHQRLIEAQGELIEAEWAASVAAMSAFEQRLGPLRAEARPA